jgi:glucose/arabinose dehydrogenase
MSQSTATGLRLGVLLGTVSMLSLVVLCGDRVIGAGQVGVPAAGGGVAAATGDDLSSQAKACLRAALGATVFNELIVAATRQPELDESTTIDFCRSATRGPSDMPVYDLRPAFNALLYPPNYPSPVLGTGGQSWFELMDVLDDDVEVTRLRRAGINTIAFTVLYELNRWGVPTIARAKEAANLVIRARIRGFAVYLKLGTFSVEVPCNGSFEENLAAWNDLSRRAAVSLARLAQELNVEYISPNNESEGALQSRCLDPAYSQDSGREPYQQMLDPAGEPGLTARVAVVSAWHVAVLAELRSVFHGRVLAHFGTVHPEAYVPGHDGLAFTLDHAHLSAEAFRTHVRTTYHSADSAARKSGDLQWLAAVFFPFSLAGDFSDAEHPDYDPTYETDPVEDARMRAMQDAYTAISIEETGQFQDQASVHAVSRYGGYLSQGWVDTGIEIRGSESEFLLSARFGGVLPQDLSVSPTEVFVAEDGTRFRVEEVVTHLESPWGLAAAPDGRLFVTERAGRVRVVQDDVLLTEPALTLPEISTEGDAGMFGITLHPDFDRNHLVYLLYTLSRPDAGLVSRLVRYREVNNTLAEAAVLVDDIPEIARPGGARIRFGPDGKLYVTVGDRLLAARGPHGAARSTAQDLASLNGKILRFNDDGTSPDDNPFYSPLFSFGHRSPQGIDWHPVSGDLWAIELGPVGYDELNRIEGGLNYGWPLTEGAQMSLGVETPVLSFAPSLTPSGGSFYTGHVMPAFRNDFFFGTLRGQDIHRVQFDPVTPRRIVANERLLAGRFGRIRDVVTGSDGALYFCTSNRGSPGASAPEDDRILRLLPVASSVGSS